MSKKKLPAVDCPTCGDKFHPQRSWQTYCSNKCRTEAWLASHVTITRAEYEALKRQARENEEAERDSQ
jgi:endogenous inhibitor of DNA gyrase (YacG/DUF329 family)